MTEKYSFINAEKANYPIVKACRWLAVSRSGYYEWKAAPTTTAARRRVTLGSLVAQVRAHSRQTYGSRRITAALRASGHPVSRRLVTRLMRAQGPRACQPRPWRATTLPGTTPAAVPDRVNRDFTAPEPGTRLVGDITYLKTWTGWLYLATVIDLATREVIGWSMAEHMRTSLIVDALAMAAGTGRLRPGCVFHSDRGAQYTSAEYAAALTANSMLGSMGRTGICWDNAAAESFFASLKKELVYRTAFPTPAHAHTAVAEYIEVVYNRQRLHSSLGYRTPAQAEAHHNTSQQAA